MKETTLWEGILIQNWAMSTTHSKIYAKGFNYYFNLFTDVEETQRAWVTHLIWTLTMDSLGLHFSSLFHLSPVLLSWSTPSSLSTWISPLTPTRSSSHSSSPSFLSSSFSPLSFLLWPASVYCPCLLFSLLVPWECKLPHNNNENRLLSHKRNKIANKGTV